MNKDVIYLDLLGSLIQLYLRNFDEVLEQNFDVYVDKVSNLINQSDTFIPLVEHLEGKSKLPRENYRSTLDFAIDDFSSLPDYSDICKFIIYSRTDTNSAIELINSLTNKPGAFYYIITICHFFLLESV